MPGNEQFATFHRWSNGKRIGIKPNIIVGVAESEDGTCTNIFYRNADNAFFTVKESYEEIMQTLKGCE